MRWSASWMNIWDDRTMELLEQGGPQPVGEIVDHPAIQVSKSTVSRRCRRLAEAGLLNEVGNGVYKITEIGEAYLRGSYNAEIEEYTESYKLGNSEGKEP